MAWLRPRGRSRAERGAELIEMAIVTPVLLMILAGIFDFGFMFRSWQVVTNAAREGARVGVLPAYLCAPGPGSDVEARVRAYMAGSGITDTDAYTVDVGTDNVATSVGNINACVVTVRLDQQLPSLGFIGRFFGGEFTTVQVSGGAIMRSEAQSAP